MSHDCDVVYTVTLWCVWYSKIDWLIHLSELLIERVIDWWISLSWAPVYLAPFLSLFLPPHPPTPFLPPFLWLFRCIIYGTWTVTKARIPKKKTQSRNQKAGIEIEVSWSWSWSKSNNKSNIGSNIESENENENYNVMPRACVCYHMSRCFKINTETCF